MDWQSSEPPELPLRRNQINSNGETSLHIAARLDKGDEVRQMLLTSVECQRDRLGYHPWHTAAAFNSTNAMPQIIELIEFSRLQDTIPKSELTILHLAAIMGHSEVMALIIEHKIIEIEARACYGMTPLFLAVFHRRTEAVKLLLEHDANVSCFTDYRMTPCSISSLFTQDLCTTMLDRIMHTDDMETTITEHYSKLFSPIDIKVFYNGTVCNFTYPHAVEILSHKTMIDVICGIYGMKQHQPTFLMVMVLILIDNFCTIYLCMLETSLLNLFEQDTLTITLVIISMVLLVAHFLFVFIFLFIRTYKTIKKDEISEAFSKIRQLRHHPEIKISFKYVDRCTQTIKNLQNYEVTQNAKTKIVPVLAKLSIAGCMFTNHPSRNYILSTAMIFAWFSTMHIIASLPWIPRSVIINLIAFKKCINAILEVLGVAIFAMVPFIFIVIKFTLLEGRCINDAYVCTNEEGGSALFNVTGSSMLHMISVMMMEDFHNPYFEDRHRSFLTFFYMIAMFILSTVIINMSIGKLSSEYEEITMNANFEIGKARLVNIMQNNLFPSSYENCEVVEC